MNKSEFIDVMKAKGMTIKEAEKAVKFYHESVQETLEKGIDISFAGYGNYETKLRNERPGRNPRTKEEIIIKAKVFPAFTFSKVIKDSVALENESKVKGLVKTAKALEAKKLKAKK